MLNALVINHQSRDKDRTLTYPDHARPICLLGLSPDHVSDNHFPARHPFRNKDLTRGFEDKDITYMPFRFKSRHASRVG